VVERAQTSKFAPTPDQFDPSRDDSRKRDAAA